MPEATSRNVDDLIPAGAGVGFQTVCLGLQGGFILGRRFTDVESTPAVACGASMSGLLDPVSGT